MKSNVRGKLSDDIDGDFSIVSDLRPTRTSCRPCLASSARISESDFSRTASSECLSSPNAYVRTLLTYLVTVTDKKDGDVDRVQTDAGLKSIERVGIGGKPFVGGSGYRVPIGNIFEVGSRG